MPSKGTDPSKARTGRSLANLRKGGGNPKAHKLTAEEKAERNEARVIARRLVNDKVYQRNLKERLREGKCQPGVEVALWYYAYGRPKEQVEVTPAVPITIRHEYAEDA